MARFGWAYVDCDTHEDGAAFGPTGSIQFLTGAGNTTGSLRFMYYTASHAGHSYNAHTVVLTGTLVVDGIISASHYHIDDVTTIDSTGSTTFGNTNDDMHIRTGSLVITGAAGFAEDGHILSASISDKRVSVRAFSGKYRTITANGTILKDDYIIGCSGSGNQTVYLPTASNVGAGALLVIKDEYYHRASTSITLQANEAALATSNLIDGQSSFILTGNMPAINLYSDGSNWLIF